MFTPGEKWTGVHTSSLECTPKYSQERGLRRGFGLILARIGVNACLID